MFLDFAKSQNVILNDFQSVIDFVKESAEARNLMRILPGFSKLIRLVLCMPVTTCTAERSFSALRRLKTYLRSTMSQERLNHTAVLNCYSEEVESLDFPALINEFIQRNPIRTSTFALYN